MKALLVDSGKLALRDVPKPSPAEGEALISVRLAGICATDLEILRGYGGYQGIIGHEFVGTIVGGGAETGRRVVGEINCVCGRCDMCQSGLSNHCRRRTVLGIKDRPGAFAEFVTLPRRNCIDVPASVSDEEAVFAEPLAAAIQVLRQVKIEPRTSVAVLGTGRLGLLVAQVLARTGCKLTAIGRNPATLAFLDRRRIANLNAADVQQFGAFDVVVDCTGSPAGLPIALRLVRPRGTVILKTTCAGGGSADLSDLVVNEVTLIGSRCGSIHDALNLLARKEVDVTGLISRELPLDKGVEALALAASEGVIKVLLRAGA
jgi:threonine dehydrogenase-like Zn-dependent dehydrogenase